MGMFNFYNVVKIRSSHETARMNLHDGQRGIIVGLSEAPGADVCYAVLVDDKTYMLHAESMDPTGDTVDRESIYGGEVIHVDPENYGEPPADQRPES